MKRSRIGLYSTLNLKEKVNAVENFRAISKKKFIDLNVLVAVTVGVFAGLQLDHAGLN